MPVCFSVHKLVGYNETHNIILYREPILVNKSYESKYIIFFPGDYSNFFTNSVYTSYKRESKNECTEYCYSYEALFWVISSKYLYDHIIFIKPCIFKNYFSMFANFLNEPDISISKDLKNVNTNTGKIQSKIGNVNPSDQNCSQECYQNNAANVLAPAKGVKHLLCLLLSLNKELSGRNEMNSFFVSSIQSANANGRDKFKWGAPYGLGNQDGTDNHPGHDKSTFEDTHECKYTNEGTNHRLVLIGFSRGCSVLFSMMREAKDGHPFWSLIDSIYLLDPSFNKSIYNTDIENSALEEISEYGLKIFVHSTPHQISNKNEMNIHSELLNFLKKLRQHRICTFPYIHYTRNETFVNPLNLHFEILMDFLDDVFEDPNESSSLSKSCKEEGITLCKSKVSPKDFLFDNWKKNSFHA
ncbi:conserved protein, unknown function [Plasmodium gonderi]|uniref:Uncharacterized protein n=1 Tax=Plasmodium gonderi TaxID=77519 RepID=A0A1Y1JDI5_PLAGO|nr:conserved protein, unknown function [Plasmodium gonderi]GAW80591.1 conserved protein, unknown function [Plasmodium gonderi]